MRGRAPAHDDRNETGGLSRPSGSRTGGSARPPRPVAWDVSLGDAAAPQQHGPGNPEPRTDLLGWCDGGRMLDLVGEERELVELVADWVDREVRPSVN